MTQPGPFRTPPVAARSGAGRPRQRIVVVVAVAGAVVIVLAAVGGFLLWRAQEASASVAALEPTNSATAEAFMPAQGPDASVAAAPARTGGAVAGNTPGLFGGTQNSSCDQDQISRFLQSHPDKGAAWAEAEGISTSDIPTYLHQLTPVLLRADSYITNHGFRDGELTSYPAVLQSGTAVLVDGYGTPRVKCYCGNPISAPPRHQPTHFEGRPWSRFAPVTVIVIQPAPVVVQNLTVINIQNNVVYHVDLPPWRYGPPPGWNTDPTTETSTPGTSVDTSTPDTDSDTPSSPDTGSAVPNQPPYLAPGSGYPGSGYPGSGYPGSECESSAGDTIGAGTTTPAPCVSTPPTTTTTTTTTTDDHDTDDHHHDDVDHHDHHHALLSGRFSAGPWGTGVHRGRSRSEMHAGADERRWTHDRMNVGARPFPGWLVCRSGDRSSPRRPVVLRSGETSMT